MFSVRIPVASSDLVILFGNTEGSRFTRAVRSAASRDVNRRTGRTIRQEVQA